MIADCCAQQRTYEKFFGLLGQRFCMIDRKYIGPFQSMFKEQYDTIHRLETNKLRNVGKFFAHLLHTDAISWEVLQTVKLNEEDTTSSSRIFIKILFQELSEYMGLHKLNLRLKDVTLQPFFEGLFPRDSPKNTRFAINFFTSVGLGGLTDELREHLKSAPARVEPPVDQPSSSSSSSSEEESDSEEEESSDDSSDHHDHSKDRRKKTAKKETKKSTKKRENDTKSKTKKKKNDDEGEISAAQRKLLAMAYGSDSLNMGKKQEREKERRSEERGNERRDSRHEGERRKSEERGNERKDNRHEKEQRKSEERGNERKDNRHEREQEKEKKRSKGEGERRKGEEKRKERKKKEESTSDKETDVKSSMNRSSHKSTRHRHRED